MKPKPVKHTHPPAYPTRSELAADGDLLKKHVPRGWRIGKGLAGAIGLFLAANVTGCGPDSASTTAVDPYPRLPPLIVLEASDWTRSIFDDGKGAPNNWGMLACVAITPPVFLPEDEAIRVLLEEGEQNTD